jgi:hypothetical protein
MAKNFEKLIFGGLHEKDAVQRGIWVPTQHLLWDQGKPRKTLIELAMRYFSPRRFAIRTLNGPHRELHYTHFQASCYNTGSFLPFIITVQSLPQTYQQHHTTVHYVS